MEKVLITGASGFIGGFLVEEAQKQGYEVFAAVRKSSNKAYLNNPEIKCIDIDFNDGPNLMSMLEKHQFDHIIHNAGITKSKYQHELDRVNAEHSAFLASTAMEVIPTLKTFVFMSSLAATGPADFQEGGIICHDKQPRPVTMYGISKLKAEKLLKSIPGLPLVIFRPTAVYGPREKDIFAVFKMVKSGIEVKIGSHAQKLTFIYVEDLVKLIINSLKNNVAGRDYFISDGHVYNGDDLNRAIKQSLNKKTIKINLPLWLVKIVASCSEIWGNILGNYPILNNDKLNELKALNWQCDSPTAFEELKYSPEYNLSKGIDKTVQWYLKNKWL